MYRSFQACRVSMYAEFTGGGTYLWVLSSFFGDSLAFSGPFREQPGQPHHGPAHPGSLGGIPAPVGVGIPQAHFQVEEPFYIFYSHRGEVHPVWSFRSGTLHSTFQAEAQLLAVNSDCYGRRKPGSHTNPSSSVCSLFFFQTQSGESNSSGPTAVEHQGRRWLCTVGRVCHVSLRAGSLLGKHRDWTHSSLPTRKK